MPNHPCFLGLKLMSLKTCNLCKSSSANPLWTDCTDYITSDDFTLISCSQCGTVSLDSIPNSMDTYYPKQYRDYGFITSNLLRLTFKIKANRWSKKISSPKNRAVLEVGCGQGILISEFKRRGWTAVGIERNAETALNARNKSQLDVYAGDVDNLPPNQKFNLIILYNVLEHLESPMDTLEKCKQKLTEGGNIVITVPDFDCWQRKVFNRVWLHLDVPRHINHFSASSFDYISKELDMSLADISPSSFIHDWFGWIDSFFSKVFLVHNPLTSWLMGLNKLRFETFFCLLIGPLLALIFFPITLFGFFCRKSALVTVVLCKNKSSP